MRNARCHQCKEKMSAVNKVNDNTYGISSIRKSLCKFHVVVVQNNGKEIYKKGVLHLQSCFFAN